MTDDMVLWRFLASIAGLVCCMIIKYAEGTKLITSKWIINLGYLLIVILVVSFMIWA